MRSQTNRGATTSMAYPTIPLPASPTLTNPDMILPYGEYDSTTSPPRGKYNSESAGGDWDDIRQTDMHFSIGPPQVHMGLMTPTTPIIYGNGTMLSDIGEVTEAESTIGRCKLPGPAERRMLKQQQQQKLHQASGNRTPLGSSPTIGYAAVMKRAKTGNHQRKMSIESTSTIKSEGQSAEIFKDFDDGVSVDDSVFQGDDEESVADSHSEQVIASETQRLAPSEHGPGYEDDRNSSAALSRRAEQILLNAKKRLNVGSKLQCIVVHANNSIKNMEGNLNRARNSLHTTPTGSLSSINSSSPLNRSTPSPHSESAVKLLGVPPSKQRQVHASAATPPPAPRHARVGSENSGLTPQRVAPFPIPFPVRSASAAARYVRNDGSKRSPPFVKAPETPREDTRVMSHSRYPTAMNIASPTHTILEPLSENDVPDFDADRASIRSSVDGCLSLDGGHRLTRSTSTMQMSDLKDQMSDLKGRLSVLRDRARDDTMKRRSLQSLRTPSPFTAAEQWYTSSQNYGEPLSADAGVASPPWKGSQNGDEEAKLEETFHAMTTDTLEYTESDITSVYEDVDEHLPAEEINSHELQVSEEVETYDNTEPQREDEDVEEYFEDEYNEEIVDREEDDDYESDVSLYHDSLSTPISHEDREDAFDYEHFFLHSAMGTISQQRLERRASFSSEDSVETVQGLSGPSANAPTRREVSHRRSESTDSVSSVDTFETATEGREPNNEDENKGRDAFAVQQIAKVLSARSHISTSLAAKRSTFGSDMKSFQLDDAQSSPAHSRRPSSTGHDHAQRNRTNIHRPSVNSFESFSSNGTTRSFPLVSKPMFHAQQHNASSRPNFHFASKEIEPSLRSDSVTLTDSSNGGERSQTSPVHMLARDDQILVERLVASLGQCVLGLQESGRASYESRVFRRRLDAARKVLEGDEPLL
ncbi:hypothetical protein WAI453_004221 [Rhynchosporium graminicola]|uniref:Uncharacterized protein n=1 Tax=Rhynchosporium graminicola TaxID=2792576 RepID=A0A1E1JX86_9HELO|nr:uncharacterized protein RCO7_08583 [Rhynchosporium commune]